MEVHQGITPKEMKLMPLPFPGVPEGSSEKAAHP